MKDSRTYKYLHNELSYLNQENNPRHGFENVSIIIVNNKRFKNGKKHNVFMQTQQHRISSCVRSKFCKKNVITRHSSMPDLHKCTRSIKTSPPRNRNAMEKDTKLNKYKKSRFQSQFILNVVSEHRDRFVERTNLFNYPRQTKLKIYRCQLGATEDNCCCSCNSDAMFEVMKGLYDCYKAKNCDNCDCVLCGHLQKGERKSAGKDKSLSGLSEQARLQKAKEEGLLTPLTDKTPEQKEKILRGLAMKGLALPEGQTASEKQLLIKVRADLGLPKEPQDKAERDKLDDAAKAGKLWPLEGKTLKEKEKILKGLQNMGIPLPEGRTPSEKSLIAKLATKSIRLSKATKKSLSVSEQMRQAKAEGLLTPLTGKSPEQKENILKGLAMKGLSLPEGQTPSEKNIIAKVRADLGLPKEPKNKVERDKHDKAAKAGLLKPLEGKTPEQKEKILKGLHNMGIPLPEGRTPSEKSLIAKIAASSRHPSKVSKVSLEPSEQMRRAKVEGLLTPLKGKTPEQKQKILEGLAKKGIPLPEGQTPSEKKLIDKVRADLGLPKEPKNKAEREKHDKAAKAGFLKPLEGKTPAQKEKILKGLHDMGIPLPEGRTPSEKSLIAKIAASGRPPSKVTAKSLLPSEQMFRAKAEGLLTPLKGKTPEQQQKILEGLAKKGIPLPEGQTPSEKQLIDKVRADLGLPKEPKNKAERDKHDKAAKAGLLKPLEGKTPAQKEKILKGLHDMGIPLPEGRTQSEKSLIAKIAARSRHPSKVSKVSLEPSEQMRRAKVEGLLTPLKGKTPEQKQKILEGLAKKGIPLPEGQTPSEKKLIDKVRADLGLPKEPKNKAERDKHDKAAKDGLLKPLEGKTPEQKEKILKGLHDLGISLPEGRTASEKSLIAKIAASPRRPSKVTAKSLSPSEQMQRAKAEGLLTPLKGKTPEQKENILKGLAMAGLPLPEGQTPSEKKLIDKVRADLALPKEPKNKAERDKHDKAAKDGFLKPLEGKTPEQKEKILKGLHDLGISLPEGRTASEKSLIAKIAASPRRPSKVTAKSLSPSEQMQRAKAEGLLTPLKGKTPEQKENILKGLAMAGLPLPEGQTSSEKKLIDKVRADLALPKEPKNKAERDKHDKAAKAGLLKPLEGKTPEQKEKILKGLHDMGIPLPEGRTASEKSLIAKVAARSRHPSKVSTVSLEPSEQMRRAKVEGLLTPLKGKTPEQKQKILEGLAKKGIPLPEGQTPSEKNLIDKVRADLGLPKEPKNKVEREKHDKAAKAGLLKPLEGKTPEQKEKILKGLHDMGIPLPEGRTASEKSLIAKIAARSRHPSKVSTVSLEPSEQMRRAKVEGLLTPLKGKTPEQKEKILKALANKGLPLPEGQTSSEKKLIDKVRADLGLPKEPKNKVEREKHDKAAKAGLLKPLEGKTPEQKEKILKGLHDMGIPLPEGRTASEKSLIAKIAARSRHPSKVSTVSLEPSEQMRRAKVEGLLTPLKGKTPEQKEKILKALANKGLSLPEGKTSSEKKLIDKVRADLGLPKEPKNKVEREKHDKAAKAGLLKPLEGKTPEQKEKILKGLHDMGIPLPEGRTASEKSLIAKIAASSRHPSKVSTVSLDPSEQMRRAKREGLLTPLKGKTPEQKEKILKALANRGLPLPEGQRSSEKKLIDKVRADLGLPKEPKNKGERDKYNKAAEAGFLKPLEGKTPAQKEKILKGLHDMGISLPEGRTPSEKSLIAKIAASSRHPSKVSKLSLEPSEQMRRAKVEGLLTPLKGKTPEQKENILKGLAMKGIPLPEGQTPSERKLVDKVRADLGLPKEPKNKTERDRLDKAAKAGLLKPLEGKTPEQKEKILKGLHDLGIALPEGRSSSEKSLIAKIAASSRHPSKISTVSLEPSEQMRRAKAEGLLTPLKGKTPEQKEKILKALANRGLPLPEGQTPSEKKIIDQVRADLGLPKEPKNKAERARLDKAAKAGLLKPLEGKTPEQKEKILKGLHDLGIALPEGRTSSEKSLIAKIAASSRHPSKVSTVSLDPSEQMRRAKREGLLTPLKGKTPEQKEKILNALANRGLPLPEGQTSSEKKLIDKVRADLGLPKEPKNKGERDKYNKAAEAGFLKPLEGKTPAQKEKILKGLHDMGISLPEGRTPSEKSLIAKIAASSRHPSKVSTVSLDPSEQMRRAKREGLLTPLKGKTPEQKEKILNALANRGLPLPEGQTSSEKKLIDKVRADLGLPKEPKNKGERDKYNKAAEAGFLKPLEGKTPAQKEKILKGLHDMGISLPEGRTPSEKSLIAKIAASSRHPSKVSKLSLEPSEQMRRAKVEGLLTPLKGKTPEQKENILKGLAMKGIPLPEGQTPSERKLVDKVRADLGLPKEPKNKAERDRLDKAAKAGFLKPLEGKTPAQKEKILKGLHDLGIALPEGRTSSEKSLIAKIAASSRHPSKVSTVSLEPSEQMRRAKAEGLLTPLKGKTPEQKEKILKALANRGLPLPEGQTPSEKKIIDQVRADLGLPKEPKNKAERDRLDKAAKAGFLKPLEGKTPAQKEKILKGLHDLGIALPEGRTSSEKSLIAKIAASSRHPSKVSTVSLEPSEQMRRAKAEGLLTPLKGKTPEQKEKILKALANRGLPLPEGQTPSEKKIIDQVRADLGLPKEPKNKAIRDKHEQAAKLGLLLPLEGKTPAQKEKILKGLHNMGIPLPEGRTPSEKSLIAKVAASSRPPSTVAAKSLSPSEQLRKAEAEGLLTPLKGKTPEQKETILTGLAMAGLPLPEGQTASEKKLIAKVRADLGLPKEPKNKAERDKYNRAAEAGLLKPLEGRTLAQKEKTLKGLHDLGISLPVGRTPSEKSLIAKIAASSRHPSKVSTVSLEPSEQMRRAKVEGLLTPLKGKTPEQKENILKGLAMKGLSLPEGQTPSEKKIIDKVRADLGLPKEPKNKAERDKYNKAAEAGFLKPLEGKTPAQKEKILKGLHDLGIPLPEGRSPSEKSLIAKIAASPRRPSKVTAKSLSPSEQMQRAKAEGLLTPLKGKTPEEKENILKGLAMAGLPLPEGQTPSEKKVIDKVRADLGLPKEPKSKAERDKHDKAARAGLLKPLEGKTPDQKEKILKGLHDLGIALPEGRTASEKSLIAKIAASSRRPSKVTAKSLSPSEQMRKAKAEGLLTPLKGKTPEEKENILKGLAIAGLPLPEGQTPSEKKVIDKVRADLGLPKEPKNKAERDKHDKAAKAGLLKPLEGKTPDQKEKILKGLHDLGIALPEGRTASEKSLIAKIAASSRRPSKVTAKSLSPSEQMRKAKAEGLLTPLTGKTPEQKQKILNGLAMAGLPLPVGQTPSEKKLIDKVRADLGLPKDPKNKAERDKHEQAAKAGLLQPLEGKSPSEKEKILKGLHNMGIRLPDGRSPSEKSLIAKIEASSRQPSMVDLGISMAKKLASGIDEEFQDIIKTTKCDRACGCDKKKIRFKHSYVKIRVTSPDISSFCDCPDECVPGVKSGAFIDNEGIKVTVGTAVGTPSITISQVYNSFSKFGHESLSVLQSKCSVDDSSFIDSSRTTSTENENIYLQDSIYEGRTSKCDKIIECLKRLQSLDDIYKGVSSETKFVSSSFGSILVIKSEISLCSSCTNKSSDTISMSLMASSITSNCTSYSENRSTDYPLSSSFLDRPTSEEFIDQPETSLGSGNLRDIETVIPKHEYTILRMSPTRFNFGDNIMRPNKIESETETEEPIILFNHLPDELDMKKIIFKVMANKRFVGASSIFIVVPASDDEEQSSSDESVSMTSIYSSHSGTMEKNSSHLNSHSTLRTSSFTEPNEQVCGKGKKFHLQEISSNGTETTFQNESLNVLRFIDTTNDESQLCEPNEIGQMLEKAVHGFGIDTTADRACCCHSKECSTSFVIQNCCSKDHYAVKAMSKHQIPLTLQDATSGFRFPDKQRPSPVASRREFTLISSKTSGSCRIPDMRTPSQESLDLLCDVPTGPRVGCDRTASKISSGCGLPDMRTPSPESLVLPCKDAPRPTASVVSSQIPHRTVSCCRFPGLSSLTALSSVLHSQVHGRPAPSHVDRSILFPRISRANVFPNKPHYSCHSPVKPIHSSKPRGHPCEMLETCDHIHVKLINPESHTDRPYDERTSGFKPDVAKQEASMEANKSLREFLPQQDANGARSIPNEGSMKKSIKSKTSLPEQMKEPAFISDPITQENMTSLNLPPSRKDEKMNLQPRRQVSWKSKIKSLNSSRMKHNCVCQDVEDSGSPNDEISSHQSCFLGKWRSKMPSRHKKTSRQKINCDRVDTENSDIITGEISGHLSKIPEHTSSEKKVKDAGIMTDEKSNRQLKTPKDPTIDDDPESLHQVITDGTENQQNNSGNKGFCVCQNMDATSKKCCKMTKLMNNVRKSISRKTSKMKGEKAICCKCLEESGKCECLADKGKDENLGCECLQEKVKEENDRCECLEEKVKETKVVCKCFKKRLMSIKKLSKKKKEAEEKSLKSLAEHGVQTIPEESKDEPCELNCGWIDIEKLMKLRSDLTECTSGFKACKKKKRKQKRRIEEQPREIELDFEDAIKYYVGKNLEQFQDLIQPLESYQEKYKSKKVRLKKKSRKEKKLAKTDIIKNENDNLKKSIESLEIPLKEPCQCPYGQTPPYETITSAPEAHEKLAKLYPKGLKVTLGAKGIAPLSPGVARMAGRGDVVERSGRDGFSQTAGRDVVIQTPNPETTDKTAQEFGSETARRDRVVQTAGHNVVVQTPGPFITGKGRQEGDTD